MAFGAALNTFDSTLNIADVKFGTLNWYISLIANSSCPCISNFIDSIVASEIICFQHVSGICNWSALFMSWLSKCWAIVGSSGNELIKLLTNWDLLIVEISDMACDCEFLKAKWWFILSYLQILHKVRLNWSLWFNDQNF